MSCTAIAIISAMVGVFVGASGGELATALVASGKPRNEAIPMIRQPKHDDEVTKTLASSA
jgi:hypothetical protein